MTGLVVLTPPAARRHRQLRYVTDINSLLATGDFEKWRTGLIYEPNRYYRKDPSIAELQKAATCERQAELDEAAESGSIALSRFMFAGMNITNPKAAVKQMPDIPPVTAAEIKSPTLHAERHVADTLTKLGVNRSCAASPRFWTLAHACWISRERIDGDVRAVFCAGRKDNTPEGRARNFIRRIGALPARVHGHHTTIMDCPLSTMWWRVELAREAADTPESRFQFEEAHQQLLANRNAVWRRLVQVCASHAPSLNAPRARAAIIQAFINWDGKLTQRHVDAACRRVAQIALIRSLHLAPWKLMVDEAESGLCDVSKAKAAKAERKNLTKPKPVGATTF